MVYLREGRSLALSAVRFVSQPYAAAASWNADYVWVEGACMTW